MDAVDVVARVYTKWPMNSISNSTTSYYMVGAFTWYKSDFGNGLIVTKSSPDVSCSTSSIEKHQNYILFGSIKDEKVAGYSSEIPVFTLDGCRPQKQAPTLATAEWQALLSYSPAPSVAPTSAPTVDTDTRAADRSATDPPTTTPTTGPTETPTTTPTTAPIGSPSTAPTETPTTTPTEAPTASPTTSSPTAAPDTFEFQVDFSSRIPTEDRPFFQVAVNRWQSVISEGHPDFSRISLLAAPPGDCSYPATIDDFYLCLSYDLTRSDGQGGFVGFAAPTYWRTPSYLPFAGVVSMDSADIEFLKSRGLYSRVILHELGHVLGIGTQWGRSGLAGAVADGCPYFGPSAIREYQALTGCADMPSELDGDVGTQCQHWDELCLGNELMTGFVGGRTQLSRITIAGLEDLGYNVNYANSDYLGPDDVHPSCMCNDRRELFEKEHGAATHLNHPSGGRHRELSAVAHDMAMAKGAEILETFAGIAHGNSSDFEFLAAGMAVEVLVMEDDELYGVVVKLDE